MKQRKTNRLWLLVLIPALALPLVAAEKQGALKDLCLDCGSGKGADGTPDSNLEHDPAGSPTSDLFAKGAPMEIPRMNGEAGFECTLTSADEARRRESIRREVLSRAVSRERTPEAWVLTFPGEAELLANLMEFVRLERECCAFLHYTLDMEPYGRSTRLKLGGPPAALEFVGSFLEADESEPSGA